MRFARVQEGVGPVPNGVYSRGVRISERHLNRVCPRSVRRRKGRGGAYVEKERRKKRKEKKKRTRKKKGGGISKVKGIGRLGVRTGGVGWWDDRDWEKTPRPGLRTARVKERPYG